MDTTTTLAEIRERWIEVTPGKWEVEATERTLGTHYFVMCDKPRAVLFAAGRSPELTDWQDQCNAIAVASAPSDIRTLLQALDAATVQYGQQADDFRDNVNRLHDEKVHVTKLYAAEKQRAEDLQDGQLALQVELARANRRIAELEGSTSRATP